MKRQIKKLTYEELEKKYGQRHISGAVHFSDNSFVTFQNSSVNQIISYIKNNEKEFLYFTTF